MLLATNGNPPKQHGITEAIATAVLGGFNDYNIFQTLIQHMMETTIEDNHVFGLIKDIVRFYCKIRFHHLAKLVNGRISGTVVRKKLTKLILFKHQ